MKPWNGTVTTTWPQCPISTLSLRENRTPAALTSQVKIDIATLGSHRGSFGGFADLSGRFLAHHLVRLRLRIAPPLDFPAWELAGRRESAPDPICQDSSANDRACHK